MAAVCGVCRVGVDSMEGDEEGSQQRDELSIMQKDGDRVGTVGFEVEPLRLEELTKPRDVNLVVNFGELLDRLRSRRKARLGRCCARCGDQLIDFHLYWAARVSNRAG